MDKLFTTKDAAVYTGTTNTYLLNQAKLGKLAYVQPSAKKIMFTQSSLDKWVASWRKFDAVSAEA